MPKARRRAPQAGSRERGYQTRARESLKSYRAMRRAVQPNVTFDIPLDPTRHWRQKLAAYHRYINGTPSSPGITAGVRVRVYRRNPERLAKLQYELGQDGMPGLKYAWVLTTQDPESGLPLPVTVIDRKVAPNKIITHGVDHLTIRFDTHALARDPAAEVARVMEELKDAAEMGGETLGAYGFQINNGAWTMRNITLERSTVEAVKNLMNTYGAHKTVVRRDPYRHWDQWLQGLTIVRAGKQSSIKRMREAQDDQRERTVQIRKINQRYTGILDVLRHGDKIVESVAREYAGDATDPSVGRTLVEMRKRGLVVGDDNRWMITRKGRDYFAAAHKILGRFNT